MLQADEKVNQLLHIKWKKIHKWEPTPTGLKHEAIVKITGRTGKRGEGCLLWWGNELQNNFSNIRRNDNIAVIKATDLLFLRSRRVWMVKIDLWNKNMRGFLCFPEEHKRTETQFGYENHCDFKNPQQAERWLGMLRDDGKHDQGREMIETCAVLRQ